MGHNFFKKKLDSVISWTKAIFQRSIFLDRSENGKKPTFKCEEHFCKINYAMKITCFCVNWSATYLVCCEFRSHVDLPVPGVDETCRMAACPLKLKQLKIY